MDYDIETLLKNLKRNRMEGFFIQDKQELSYLLPTLVPAGSTVGVGGSVTLDETGILDFLRGGDYTFYDRYADGLTPEDIRQVFLKSFGADVYLTSTNAITMDGKLFNIDGNGNRVAAMIYGPRRVIVIAGKNKIVPDVDTAIQRARQTAAPLNTKRLNRATPCVELGKCIDCKSEERICNEFVLISGQYDPDRIKVIIINEDLGY